MTPAVAAPHTSVVAHVSAGFDELPSLQRDWERLFRACDNEPSTSFEWTAAMVRHHLRPGDRPFLLRLERQGALVGVVPLVVRTLKVMGRPISLLTPISEDYSTHSDLLFESADPEIVRAAVTALFELMGNWDVFRMARLLDSNPLHGALCDALVAGDHRYSVREGLAAYLLELPASYATYLANRSAKFRNHLRRTERKLAERGAIGIHEVSSEAELETAFDALMTIERASWKHAHGTAISAIDRQQGFYRECAAGAMKAGRLHLQWMTVEQKPIAYNLGYLTAGGYHYLKTSYDHEYRPLGPATMLRARLIESLIARGVKRMDFPGEPYQWESQWTDTFRRRVVLSVYSPSVRGRAVSALERLRRLRPTSPDIQHVDPRNPSAPRPVLPPAKQA